MIAKNWKDYEVIACGGGQKLERWKNVYLLRPDPQAIWAPPFDLERFPKLNAVYSRSNSGGGYWQNLKPFPNEWKISYDDLTFLIKPMGFKHTGLFPEQALNWDIMKSIIKNSSESVNVLNLFGYTGGASVMCAKAGAKVTHVDAAKNMVERCKSNASLSFIPTDRIRYIVDDCNKFVLREKKRGKTYNAVIMDPPSYGRGPTGEMWKLEDSLSSLVENVTKILDKPLFFLINSYTTGLQPTVIDNMLALHLARFKGYHTAFEVCLPVTNSGVDDKIVLPCGCSGWWTKEKINFTNGK